MAPGQQTGDGAEEVEHDDSEGIPVIELRQGAGEEQEQQSNGAGEGEGHQGWKEKVLYKFTYLL